jgi:hypothetical protein
MLHRLYSPKRRTTKNRHIFQNLDDLLRLHEKELEKLKTLKSLIGEDVCLTNEMNERRGGFKPPRR